MYKCFPSRNVEVKSIWMNVSTGINFNLILPNLRSLRKSWSISEMAWTSWEWGLGWIFSFFNRRSFQWRRVPTVTINFPHHSHHRNHSYHRSYKYSSQPSPLSLLSPLSLSSSSSSSTSSSSLWGERSFQVFSNIQYEWFQVFSGRLNPIIDLSDFTLTSSAVIVKSITEKEPVVKWSVKWSAMRMMRMTLYDGKGP